MPEDKYYGEENDGAFSETEDSIREEALNDIMSDSAQTGNDGGMSAADVMEEAIKELNGENTPQNAQGGFQQNADGTFPQNAQGGFQHNADGAFPQSAQGGFQQNADGAFPQNVQGGFQQNADGTFPQNAQGGFQQNANGVFPQNSQGGFQQNIDGTFPQNVQGGFQQSTNGAFPQNAQGGFQQNTNGAFPQSAQGGFQQNTNGAFPQNAQGGQYGPYVPGSMPPPYMNQYYYGWPAPPQWYGYAQPPVQGNYGQPPMQNSRRAQGDTVPPAGYPYPYPPQGAYCQMPAHQYAASPEKKPRGKKKKEKRPKNIGLRVFVCVLSVVLAASAVLSVLYFVSPHSVGTGRGTSPSSSPSDSIFTSSEQESSYPGGSFDMEMPISGRPESDKLSPAEIAGKVMPSVVGIVVYSPRDSALTSWATGIVLTDDGYIVTNDHIYADIPGAEFIVVTGTGGKYEAGFVDGDMRSDLAVLKIEENVNLTPAEFGDSDGVAVGDEVIAIGNPYSVSLSGSVTGGIVSATGRRVTGGSTYTMKLIQTDAAINPGNSGGPLVNSYGQVIGINSSKIKLSGYEGIGFAIPSATAKEVVESLVKCGYVENRAKLGITFRNIDFFTARQQGLPEGLCIAGISDGSGLSGKGVSDGDIITHIDGVSLSEARDFMDLIETKSPGDTVSLRVYRASGGDYIDISAVLQEDRGESSYTPLQ